MKNGGDRTHDSTEQRRPLSHTRLIEVFLAQPPWLAGILSGNGIQDLEWCEMELRRSHVSYSLRCAKSAAQPGCGIAKSTRLSISYWY